jgi:hypothetical protein
LHLDWCWYIFLFLTLFGYFVKNLSRDPSYLHDLFVHVDHELVLVSLELSLIEYLIHIECPQKVRMDQPQNETKLHYFVHKGAIRVNNYVFTCLKRNGKSGG